MYDLVSIEEFAKPVLTSQFKIFTPEKIERLLMEMGEVVKHFPAAGRSDTQFTSKHMNIFLLGRTPWSIMRQCMAKIQNSKQALREATFRQKRSSLEIEKKVKELQNLIDSASNPMTEEEDFAIRSLKIDLEEKQSEIAESTLYLEGAMKNIAQYASIFQQVKEHANIPDDWDELDYEKAEAEHHMKQAFLQSLRDMMASGRINPGDQEYLENCGIGAITGQIEIRKFLSTWETRMKNGEPSPVMKEIDEWLNEMIAKYKHLPTEYISSYGIEPIDEWYVYRSEKKEEDEEREEQI
jgi:hypothetical protein